MQPALLFISLFLLAVLDVARAETATTGVTIQQSIDLSIAAIVLASVAIVALIVVLILRTQRCSGHSDRDHGDAAEMRAVAAASTNSRVSTRSMRV